ncbi:MAG: elongation factor EF-2 [Candidatus Micrarchaeales archaeon]
MGKKEYMLEEIEKLMLIPEQIRNIAIVAHVDHGKTTLSDNLIAGAGIISEETAGKQLVMDYEKIEQQRSMTIKASNISLAYNFENKDYLINLIDTPGHVDFGGHVTRSMRAVDGVILVVDSVEGVMPQTETVLRQSLKERAKPVLFINKIDRLINELKLNYEQMQEKLTSIINDVNKLIKANAPKEFVDDWLINVAKGNVAFGSAYNKWAISYPFSQRTGINFKTIYEYCSKKEHEKLREIAPSHEVVFEMVIKHLPNPKEAQKYRIPVIWHGDLTTSYAKDMMEMNKDGKVIMVVFGVVVDIHAGEVAVGRVFSGTVRKGTEVYVGNQAEKQKIQQVGVFMGKERKMVEEVPAGNIAAIVGLKNIFVGETISEERIEPFEEIKHYSEPVVTKSIEAKDTRDLVKLVEALKKMAKEDPTLRVEINQETGEHLVSGMGELHLEIVETKLKDDYKIDVIAGPPIVVYRETIEGKAGPVEGKTPNRHSKFYVVVEPLEKGVIEKIDSGEIPEGKPKGKKIVEVFVEGGMPRDDAKNVVYVKNKCVLIDATRGVQFMNEVMESLIEGFKEAVDDGPLAREKCLGVKVKIVDALIHEDPVHRGPAQVIPAIKRATYAAMLMANTILLEPKQRIRIQIPEKYLSDVIAALQGRRGEILSINQEGELVTVIVKAPVAEMLKGFSDQIRGITQGRAIWYYEYAGYEKLPKELMQKIVESVRERKGVPKEPPKPEDFLEK